MRDTTSSGVADSSLHEGVQVRWGLGMRRRLAVLLFVGVFAAVSGCGSSGAFTIKSKDFHASSACDATGTIEVSTQNGQVQAKPRSDYKAKMLASGMPSVWCSGAKQQFVGTVKVSGYTFESDASKPLTFVVDRDKGFYYSAGKGKVTDPQGKVTTLP